MRTKEYELILVDDPIGEGRGTVPWNDYIAQYIIGIKGIVETPKCECGKEKFHFMAHSKWCPKHEDNK